MDFEDLEKLNNGILILIGVIWIYLMAFGLDFFNYYMFSALIISQIFFRSMKSEETLILTTTKFIYKSFFYKKSRKIKSYQIVDVKIDKNRLKHNYVKPDYKFTKCILLQGNKFEFKILKTKWEDEFDEIYNFLKNHYPENRIVKRPYMLFVNEDNFISFMLLTSLVSFILATGIFFENRTNTNREYIFQKEILSQNGYYQKGLLSSILKDSGDLILPIKDFPKNKLYISKHIISKLKKEDKISIFKKNDTIGIYLDKEDYSIKLIREKDYPFFTSHFLSKRKVNVYGLVYHNEILFKPDFETPSSRNERMLFIMPLFFSLLFLLALATDKAKYLD